MVRYPLLFLSLDSNNEGFPGFRTPGNTRPSGKLNLADRLISNLGITNKWRNNFQFFLRICIHNILPNNDQLLLAVYDYSHLLTLLSAFKCLSLQFVFHVSTFLCNGWNSCSISTYKLLVSVKSFVVFLSLYKQSTALKLSTATWFVRKFIIVKLVYWIKSWQKSNIKSLQFCI